MATVSLCMIVRNEEAHLSQCLTSVQPYVDEIIVVDTGSQDQTPSIAKQFGAQVYRFEWKDHFAEARNYALKRARGDWLLVLDADERLLPVDAELFRRLLTDDSASGYYVLIRHLRSNKPDDYETDSVCRLFRNLPGVSYQGRVHEDIGKSLNLRYPHLSIKRSELAVSHYGYLREDAQAEHRSERNLKLLERAVREDSDPFFYRYAIGVESFIQERYSQAAEHLAPLLPGVPPSAGYAADLAYKLGYALWRTGQNTAALKAVETGLVREPSYAELQELRGVLLLEEGRPEEAYHQLIRYAGTASFTEERQRERSPYWMGLVHKQLGNRRQALDHWERCLHSPAYRELALPRWLDLALLTYPVSEVKNRLQAVPFPLHEADLSILLCRYVTKWGFGSQMLPLLQEADGTEGDAAWRELAFYRSILLAQTGETIKASAILQQLVQAKPEKHLLLYWWALQNNGSNPLVQLNLLYAYRETEPKLAELADLLLNGTSAAEPDKQLLEQSSYAMLMMRAWSGFQLIGKHLQEARQQGIEALFPAAWRPSLYGAPAPVRQIILQQLHSGAESFGEQLFAAQLTYSLGDKEGSKTLFRKLIQHFPQRLEPRIGLYGVLNNSDEASLLLLSDL